TEQAESLPELDIEGLPQLVKRRDSAFVGTDLLQRLRTWGTERILLAGVTEQAESLPELDIEGLPQLVKRRDSAFVGTDLL
ncbi:hypothetical protein CTI14_67965, partial [Methylobacterium radiotolerans]